LTQDNSRNTGDHSRNSTDDSHNNYCANRICANHLESGKIALYGSTELTL